MIASNVKKLAAVLVISTVMSISGALAALAQDAPPSINFSFGDDSSSAPPSLGAPKTQNSSEKPPSLQAPTYTEEKTTPKNDAPPSLKYDIPKDTTTKTQTPTSTTTPKDDTTTPPSLNYMANVSTDESQPKAPTKKTKLPATGPEILFLLAPTLAGSVGYKLYRNKKSQK